MGIITVRLIWTSKHISYRIIPILSMRECSGSPLVSRFSPRSYNDESSLSLFLILVSLVLMSLMYVKRIHQCGQMMMIWLWTSIFIASRLPQLNTFQHSLQHSLDESLDYIGNQIQYIDESTSRISYVSLWYIIDTGRAWSVYALWVSSRLSIRITRQCKFPSSISNSRFANISSIASPGDFKTDIEIDISRICKVVARTLVLRDQKAKSNLLLVGSFN